MPRAKRSIGKSRKADSEHRGSAASLVCVLGVSVVVAVSAQPAVKIARVAARGAVAHEVLCGDGDEFLGREG